jgi:hypothetical protein
VDDGSEDGSAELLLARARAEAARLGLADGIDLVAVA